MASAFAVAFSSLMRAFSACHSNFSCGSSGSPVTSLRTFATMPISR